MKAIVLSSGSKGNTTYIETNETKILIDAGNTCKYILEKLSEYNKIFSISHLVEKMQRERKKVLEKIDLCNKKIEPKTYVENKNKIQKDFNLLKDINFDTTNDISNDIKKINNFFLEKILLCKIEKAQENEEIIDIMYELRYYNFLPYTKEKVIGDIKEFNEKIDVAKENIIKKLFDNKIINTISTNEKNDIEIVKNIFNKKIMNLEDIYLEINNPNKDNIFNINIYDEKETLETQIQMNLEFNKKDKIKLNRKIKLFN